MLRNTQWAVLDLQHTNWGILQEGYTRGMTAQDPKRDERRKRAQRLLQGPSLLLVRFQLVAQMGVSPTMRNFLQALCFIAFASGEGMSGWLTAYRAK